MVVQSRHISSSEIIQAVESGFTVHPKRLPSWLLYDQMGDALFQQIMRLPSYYPTRCEAEILTHYKEDFFSYFIEGGKPFNLIELGAGDGTKTEILIQTLINHHARFTYLPIDVSADILRSLQKRLHLRYPGLTIDTQTMTYSDAVANLPQNKRNVILFLGANIGNLSIREATGFLEQTASRMGDRDVMVIGFDLKKDPRIVEAAYDDPKGVTREFNRNVLRRLNTELGAQFRLDQFEHFPFYNPETGMASSYLISMVDQDVRINALEKSFHFSQWETIHTEISQKYDLLMIERALNEAGLEITDLFFDRQHYFCNVVASKKKKS